MWEGSCLCGEIRYTLAQSPASLMMCHCQKCRKASGTAFAVNGLVRRIDMTWQAGEALVTRFESSPGVFRVFCSRCGSPLYSERPTADPEHVRLRIGSLDTPIETRPQAHIFVGTMAEWDRIEDDLPQFNERPPA
ncbi:GFA family protein [Larsenimonas rhizosphaerae]|uniref:GFA family protein n=1 Tax=Larsenimonas rhizosphaerae TaxID=2944682 RepID=A0AA41ZLT2_9GAMM|nr:GFA family protein [Larsenimonas rhizosphaerae]MCX2523200.1 GFA family protein [Larsenimonas rhizosphaerae]